MAYRHYYHQHQILLLIRQVSFGLVFFTFLRGVLQLEPSIQYPGLSSIGSMLQ